MNTARRLTWKISDKTGDGFTKESINDIVDLMITVTGNYIFDLKGLNGTKTYLVIGDYRWLIQHWNGTEFADIRCSDACSELMDELGDFSDPSNFRDLDFALEA